MQKAQKLTDPSGNYKEDSISDELFRRFEKENIQSVGTDECRIQIQELEAQLECIDDIDVEVIRRFKMHKKNVADLEQEIERMVDEAVAEKLAPLMMMSTLWGQGLIMWTRLQRFWLHKGEGVMRA